MPLDVSDAEQWFIDQLYATTPETVSQTVAAMSDRLQTLTPEHRAELSWYLEAVLSNASEEQHGLNLYVQEEEEEEKSFIARLTKEMLRRGIECEEKASGDDLEDEAVIRLSQAMYVFLLGALRAAAPEVAGLLILAELIQAVTASLSGSTVQLDEAAKPEKFGEIVAPKLTAALRAAYIRGARAGDEPLINAQITVRFDVINPLAAQWAERESSKRIVEITEDQRAAVRELVRLAVGNGRTPQQIAIDIRSAVGLHSKQVRALEKFRGKLNAKVLDGLLSADKADKRVEKYAKALLKQRGETIARTEVLSAAHAGQRAIWMEAMKEGKLHPNRTFIRWIVTEDDRLDAEVCEPMDGEEIPINGTWELPDGRRVAIPTESHPNCRCSQGLVFHAAEEGEEKATSAFHYSKHEVTARAKYSEDQPRDEHGRWTTGVAHQLAQPSSHYHPANPAAPDTHGKFKTRDGYTDERKRLHEAIRAQTFHGLTPVEEPVAVFLGGGPASGKSSLLSHLQLPSNRVTLDPDAIKAHLPEYREGVAAKSFAAAAQVHEESSEISRSLMHEAAGGKYNLLLDTVGDSGMEKLKGKVADLRKGGAKVVAHYVTVPTATALERVQTRAQQTGRLVPTAVVKEMHAVVSQVFPRAVAAGLFDEATLWHTEGTPKQIASAKGTALTIHDQALYQAFLDKAQYKG